MDAGVAWLEAVGRHGWLAVGALAGFFLCRTRIVKAICWNLLLRAMHIPLDQRQAFIKQIARKDFDLPPSERRPDS
jgi:hypothetical protein